MKPPLYSEGEAVEANFRNKGGWYPATIKVARINNGGTRVYNLAYFDGDVERGVPVSRTSLLECCFGAQFLPPL